MKAVKLFNILDITNIIILLNVNNTKIKCKVVRVFDNN